MGFLRVGGTHFFRICGPSPHHCVYHSAQQVSNCFLNGTGQFLLECFPHSCEPLALTGADTLGRYLLLSAPAALPVQVLRAPGPTRTPPIHVGKSPAECPVHSKYSTTPRPAPRLHLCFCALRGLNLGTAMPAGPVASHARHRPVSLGPEESRSPLACPVCEHNENLSSQKISQY